MSTIIYLVAGLSSRFGGKIKQFAIVGPKNETLIELSMHHAINAGFNKIIFVVGSKTQIPFKEKFGNSFENIPIDYALQEFDIKDRDRPWGTTDALVCAKKFIKDNFVVCNGDDLYGEIAFKQAIDFIKDCSFNEGVAIGYELGKVIPDTGKTNRGLFEINSNNFVTNINEIFDIEKNDLSEKNLNTQSLVSMNLFGFNKKVISLLEEKLLNFKKNNFTDRKKECLLPVEISNLIKENKIRVKLIPTTAQWFGVTNPEDEEIIRDSIKKINFSKIS
ncbi:MAG: sugar phosphate nucleotidyltransferase [Candidatus ainarchaeum sp.]|nr:sugar phosphate nucleotidyltransferase [Candidatus ainarchaeum sp.]